MHTHYGLEHRADCVDISLLAALLSTSRVQDVAPVQDQEQHVHLRRLQALLTRAILNHTEVICLQASKQNNSLTVASFFFFF